MPLSCHAFLYPFERVNRMSEFNFSEFASFSLEDDDDNNELTRGALPPFPERAVEQVVDPALLLIDPLGHTRGNSSTTSLSALSSGEGGSAQPATTGNISPSGPKSPLQLGVDLIKNFGSDKKITRDGQPAKRRGPKPDSKPALTRRQELNRQAQRSHRERKEQYMKALETEITRLRENYSRDLAMNNSLKTEVSILKEVLTDYGIPWQQEMEQRKAARNAVLGAPSSTIASTSASRSISGSQAYHGHSTLTPATSATSGHSPPFMQAPASYTDQRGSGKSDGGGSANPPGFHTQHQAHQHVSGPSSLPPSNSTSAPAISPSQGSAEIPQVMEVQRGVFEEDPQLGIDFVLSLEQPCHGHKPILLSRSAQSPDTPEEAQIYGHALMASCAPPSDLSFIPGQEPKYSHRTYDLPHADLEKLLNLSRQLVVDGQLTPIEALSQLRNHNQYRSLTREDIRNMIDDLNRKVRCYGFGAVLEDFEVKDSLSGILATKIDTYRAFKDEDFMEE